LLNAQADLPQTIELLKQIAAKGPRNNALPHMILAVLLEDSDAKESSRQLELARKSLGRYGSHLEDAIRRLREQLID
jgi:hypothetical protein